MMMMMNTLWVGRLVTKCRLGLLPIVATPTTFTFALPLLIYHLFAQQGEIAAS